MVNQCSIENLDLFKFFCIVVFQLEMFVNYWPLVQISRIRRWPLGRIWNIIYNCINIINRTYVTYLCIYI